MNALRNKVQLIGRLGKDAETITFDDGKVKARFPVATNEQFRNGEGEKVERTQWHDVIAWDLRCCTGFSVPESRAASFSSSSWKSSSVSMPS